MNQVGQPVNPSTVLLNFNYPEVMYVNATTHTEDIHKKKNVLPRHSPLTLQDRQVMPQPVDSTGEISPSCTAVSVIFVAHLDSNGWISVSASSDSLRKTSVRRDKMLERGRKHTSAMLTDDPGDNPRDNPRFATSRMFTPCSTLAYRTKDSFFQCPKPHLVRQSRHAVT